MYLPCSQQIVLKNKLNDEESLAFEARSIQSGKSPNTQKPPAVLGQAVLLVQLTFPWDNNMVWECKRKLARNANLKTRSEDVRG